jgi:hypothetical protein
MPNYSARDMLLRMANGGEATYGKYGQTAADLLAAEQRILGEIAASPDTWDVATAYNAILESRRHGRGRIKSGREAVHYRRDLHLWRATSCHCVLYSLHGNLCI